MSVSAGATRQRRIPRPRGIGVEQPIELPEGTWARIARKAYELWEERGRRENRASEDWLDAEIAVMDEIHEARE